MSAAPQTSPLAIAPPADPAPRGVGLIDLETAARRSGLSVGQLKRKCLVEFYPAGLAEKVKAGPGKATWRVREDADPRLARVAGVHQVGADLRKYAEAKRKQAIERKALLDEWESAIARRADRVTALDASKEFCRLKATIDGRPVGVRTLELWRKAYRQGGLEALIDGRGKEAAPWADHPMLDEVKRLYLSRLRPTVAACVMMATRKAQDEGWPVASYKTAQRFLAQLPRGVLLKYRDGEKAYVDHAEPYLERDYSQLASNDLWNADHHQFDVICVHEGKHVRPWLTAWQDNRSRKIVGWSIFAGDPNTDTIVDALAKAVRAHGKPAACHVDNGKDFDSYALHGRTKAQRRVKVTIDADRTGGIFTALDIKAANVQRYHGQSKPIERFFGTLEDRFGRTWSTYCGNKPENKPEGLQKALDKGEAPTVDELAAAFSEWLETDYHQRPHAGDGLDGKTPQQVFDEQLVTKVVVAEELLAELMLPLTPPVKVGQNGVTWNRLRYGQYEPALARLLGRDVRLRIDAADLTRVRVYTAEGKFLCLARANERLPANASKEQLRAALGEKRRHRKIVAEYHDVRPRLADDVPELMRQGAAARNRQSALRNPQSPPPPPSIRPLRSPLEDQLPAVGRAIGNLPLRLAAGGERDVPAPPRRTLLDAGNDLDLDDGPPAPRTGPSLLSLAERLGEP